MRRASLALLARSGALASAEQQAVAAGCGAAAGQVRRFAAGEPPKIVPNPLQQIVPPIISGIGAAVSGLKSGSAALLDAITSGPATRSAIAAVADHVLLNGTVLSADQIDLPKWAAWLAANGYANKAGWDKILAALKASASSLQPADIEALGPALHSVGRYDRELFEAFAGVVKARFVEFGTPGLAALLPVYAAHDYFDAALWDDVADAITYANHYLAPGTVPLPDIAALLAAYAKYEVNRGDLFVALSRCIHEDRVSALDDAGLKQVVGSLLTSFKALAFFPDCTEALLVAARLRPGALGPAENAIVAEVEAELRAQVPGGQLPWLDGGFKDPEHFHGGAFGSYNLWVCRDELAPTHYRPSDLSPRPASSAAAPPEPPAATPPAASP